MNDKHNTRDELSPTQDQVETPQESISETATPISNAGGPSVYEAPSTHVKKVSKAKIFVVIWVLLVLAGGVYAYVSRSQDTNVNQPAAQQQTPDDADAPVSPIPFGMIYASTKEPKNDTAPRLSTLHIQPFGNEKKESHELPENVYVSHHAVYQDSLIFLTEPGADSSEKTTLWLSKDGGKTIEKLFEGSGIDENGLPDQVTSIAFSRDGKSVLMAYLPAGMDKKNTVKQIDIETKKSSDLFTSDDPGVFIAGFDTQEGRIHYYSGCYNCDGNTRSTLLVHDVTDGSDKTVYDFGDRLTSEFAINSNHSKMLVSKGSQATEGLGDGPPYDLVEIDLASGTETPIASSKKPYTSLGYRAGDDIPYFVQGNKINSFDNDQVTIIFETENDIFDTYLVSTDFVIGSTGTFEKERVFRYDYSSKSVTSLLNIQNSQVFGLSWR